MTIAEEGEEEEVKVMVVIVMEEEEAEVMVVVEDAEAGMVVAEEVGDEEVDHGNPDRRVSWSRPTCSRPTPR